MRSNKWLALVFLLFSLIVGIAAYNVGVSHGLAQAAVAAGDVPAYAYGWGWPRPWGFGFGFPIFFFLLFWLVLARGFFWYGPRRHWRAYDHDRFEDWHRRAHERMQGGQA